MSKPIVEQDTCPKCGMDDIEQGDEIKSGDWQNEGFEMKCPDCGTEWQQWFRAECDFSGIDYGDKFIPWEAETKPRPLDAILAENAAMRKLLQRVVDHFGEGAESPLAVDAQALLESAPCQFCGEPIPHHDPDCATVTEEGSV